MRRRLLFPVVLLLSMMLTGCVSLNPHDVSTPNIPSGPSSGNTGESLSYSTGGATCSQGHSVQYQFDWGDGTYGSWSSSTSANKTWSSAGTYQVKAQARCATSTTVVSRWSSAKQVTIGSVSPYCIPVKEILDDFEANEVAARMKYGDGIITVCGYVNSVRVSDFTGEPYVTLAESVTSYRLRWVFCEFTASAMPRLAQLKKGDFVHISGRLGTTLAGSVWLKNSVLK